MDFMNMFGGLMGGFNMQGMLKDLESKTLASVCPPLRQRLYRQLVLDLSTEDFDDVFDTYRCLLMSGEGLGEAMRSCREKCPKSMESDKNSCPVLSTIRTRLDSYEGSRCVRNVLLRFIDEVEASYSTRNENQVQPAESIESETSDSSSESDNDRGCCLSSSCPVQCPAECPSDACPESCPCERS